MKNGVANRARTGDVLNHNQVFYQLNYSHHIPLNLFQKNGGAYWLLLIVQKSQYSHHKLAMRIYL